jgi:hypothetical protein
LSALLCERSPVHGCILDSRLGDAGAGDDPFTARTPSAAASPAPTTTPPTARTPSAAASPAPTFDREDPFEGSVPGADEDPFEREDPFEGSVPGADDDPFEREDPFDPVLPFAAKLYEPPAPISATVARAASGRSFLLMFHSCVW